MLKKHTKIRSKVIRAFLYITALSSLSAGESIIPVGLREANIQDIINLFYGVSVSVAVLMIILNGFKWITADDDNDRKQAKEGVIHVLMGLAFILIAAALVDMVYMRPSY